MLYIDLKNEKTKLVNTLHSIEKVQRHLLRSAAFPIRDVSPREQEKALNTFMGFLTTFTNQYTR